MTTTIWILKLIIGLLFIFTGISKIIVSKTKLLEKGMKGFINLDQKQIKIVGILELIGAIGLIFPSLINVYNIVSAISALCLGFTMIVAGWINFKLKLSILPNIIIYLICIFIAYWELL